MPCGARTELVSIEDMKDIAALRSPRTALNRLLRDKPEATDAAPKTSEARTET
jgi:hypothetical protein